MRGHQAGGWETHLQDTRIHDRYETSQLVEVLSAQNEIVGRLENLSRSGARILSLGEHNLDVGNAMTVRLIDGTHLDGSVIWRTANGFGFHFQLFLQNPTDHLHFDHMGADFCRRLLTLQTKAITAMAEAKARQTAEPVVLMPERATTAAPNPGMPRQAAPGTRAAPMATPSAGARMPRRYFPGVERISIVAE